MAARHVKTMMMRRFRAFEHFSISFGPTAVLVGPNNAGKSTAISALRAVSQMLRAARRLHAKTRIDVGDAFMWSHPFSNTQVWLDDDSLRWESVPDEVTVSVEFLDGYALKAVWPPEAEGHSFFYLHGPERRPLRDPADVRALLPTLGIVPSVVPLERREELLDLQYVRDNLGRRLSSRHFRNQLYRARRGEIPDFDWTEWSQFLAEWLPEIAMQDPVLSNQYLDLYYRDHLRPAWKEVVWAGDGFQVFIQLLFHLYRLRNDHVLVIDEPDVFLHADLQRRLMQAADTLERQLIVATHSTEIVAEIGPAAVVWMDRTRTKAIRAPEPEVLRHVAGGLGSQFNIRLARVLRAKLALFVEGEDMRILRRVARLIGAEAFYKEEGLALVPIEGASNWRRLEGFAWLSDNLLAGSVEGLLILDRDYHCDDYADSLSHTISAAGLGSHIWSRKELESYLLIDSLISRIAGASREYVAGVLAEITESMYEDVLFNHVSTFKQDFPDQRGQSDGTIGKRFMYLREVWKDPIQRLWRCPAKLVWADLNSRLQQDNHQPVSIGRAARSLRADEVPDEMASVVRRVNRRLIGLP